MSTIEEKISELETKLKSISETTKILERLHEKKMRAVSDTKKLYEVYNSVYPYYDGELDDDIKNLKNVIYNVICKLEKYQRE